MALEVKEVGRVPLHQWTSEIRGRFPEPPKGPIVVTTSHIPASLDITSLWMIRKALGWDNPVIVLHLDTVPPKVDYGANFHGPHGYEKGSLKIYPGEEFWNKNKPYHILELPNVHKGNHIHEGLSHHPGNISDFHMSLKAELYNKLRFSNVKIVPASVFMREEAPKILTKFVEKYGIEGLSRLLKTLESMEYVLSDNKTVRGNVQRFVGGIRSSADKKGRKLLLALINAPRESTFRKFLELLRNGKIYLKGELMLAVLLLGGYNHWGNNYLLDPFSINKVVKPYGGGVQITDRFKDGWSPVRLYFPTDKTTAISSVVNVLLHHGIDPVEFLREKLEKGEHVDLIVPPRI